MYSQLLLLLLQLLSLLRTRLASPHSGLDPMIVR
jgi:hypothetical protein